MNRFWFACMALCITFVESQPVAITPSTTFIGSDSPIVGVDRFLGIRYAQPPLGDLRFHSPEPFTPIEKETFATDFGASCLQLPDAGGEMFPPPDGPESEDCLFLNVFTPARTSSLRPVMVWVHGGGWTLGGSAQYEGDRFVSVGDVVVVTINYRLGAFGWAYDLRFDDPATSGNYGLLDMHLALQWVQENIQFFGGDPNSVTVFGESAGAINLSFLMVIQEFEGLQNRIIIESGAALTGTAGPAVDQWNKDVVEDFTQTVIEGVGCSQASDEIECLRQVDAQDILKFSTLSWVPVVDGVLVRDDPAALFARGEFVTLEGVMVGSNDNESTIFTTNLLTKTPQELISDVKTSFPDDFEAILDLYNQLELTPGYTFARLMTDFTFQCPSRRILDNILKFSPTTTTFSYHFSQLGSWIECPGEFCYQVPELVAHGEELVFVWPQTGGGVHSNFSAATPDEQRLSTNMNTYWTNFATTNDAGFESQGFFRWPEYGATHNYIDLSTTLNIDIDFRGVFCDFWDSITLSADNE